LGKTVYDPACITKVPTINTPFKEFNPLLDPVPVYIFKLTNTGNTHTVAHLEVLAPFGMDHWVRPSQESIQIYPGDTARFFVTIEPVDQRDGFHRFGIKAVTDGASSTAFIDLSVLERAIMMTGLEVRSSGSATWESGGRVTTGRDIEVQAWIDNIGSDQEHKGRTFTVDLVVDGQTVSTKTFEGPDGLVAVRFDVSLAQGSHPLAVRVHATGEFDTEDNELSMKVDVEGTEIAVPTGAAAAGVALTTGTLLFGAILTNEGWKFKALLLFVVPLYTRLKKETTLDNFTRGRIFGYIEANPGEHYNAIKKALELPNGSLAYHIDTLVREGFVKYELDGNYKRFYPKHMKLIKKDKETLRPGYMSKIQEIILKKIKEEPGISQRAIARALNLSPSTINYHVRTLAMAGIIRLERGISRSKIYIEKEPEDEPVKADT